MTVLFRAAHGINHSLWDLRLDYVDLMLIHQPGWNDEAVYWALEQAVRDGKVLSIGISNYYTPEAVEEILSFAKIMPAVYPERKPSVLSKQSTAGVCTAIRDRGGILVSLCRQRAYPGAFRQ